MKSIIAFVASASLVGFLIALSLYFFWSSCSHNIPEAIYMPAFKAVLILFPFMLGAMDFSAAYKWGVDAFILMAFNAIFYGFLGFMLWLGIRKNKLFLIVECLLVLVLCWRIILLH